MDEKNATEGHRAHAIHAITPIHVGAGRGTGFIDLPVNRERTTGWPCIPGSAIKGIVKAYFHRKGKSQQWIHDVFGTDHAEGSAASGKVAFTNARIGSIPIRSIAGTFAHVTCPLVLLSLLRSFKSFSLNAPDLDGSLNPGKSEILGTMGNVNQIKMNGDGKVILEEFDLDLVESDLVGEWASWISSIAFSGDKGQQEQFEKRFLVVHDDVFDHLSKYLLQVDAHVRIMDDVKLAAEGALWYEECLPSETMLFCFTTAIDESVNATRAAKKLHQEMEAHGRAMPLQVGGNLTTGKGLIRFVTSKGE